MRMNFGLKKSIVRRLAKKYGIDYQTIDIWGESDKTLHFDEEQWKKKILPLTRGIHREEMIADMYGGRMREREPEIEHISKPVALQGIAKDIRQMSPNITAGIRKVAETRFNALFFVAPKEYHLVPIGKKPKGLIFRTKTTAIKFARGTGGLGWDIQSKTYQKQAKRILDGDIIR